MADRVPHGKRFSRIPLKALPKQTAPSPPPDETAPKPSLWPQWLRGRHALLVGIVAALLIVAIPFTSARAVYSWLSHRSAVAQVSPTPVVESLPVVQAAPIAPVQKIEPTTQPLVQVPPVNSEPLPPQFKRRDNSTEEELRQQLLLAPDVSLDSVPKTSAQLHTLAAKASARGASFPGPVGLLSTRPDFQGLPFRMGSDCKLDNEEAEHLQTLSRKLRELMDQKLPKGGVTTELDAEPLRDALVYQDKKDWLRPEAVPCLVQMMQVENAPVRMVLVEVLGQISDKQATRALAKRAMTDLNPKVREAAARELLQRPRADYRSLLLGGLRYPWTPVAVHAAETLAFVKDKGAVPDLVSLLSQPDTIPLVIAHRGEKEVTAVRELVRINHLRNCLMCHPGSFSRTDLVRGRVPTPGESLPAPLNSPQYYDGSGTILVRADTTYLKQDFSVMQPVPNHDKWPEQQRFDYFVRTRPATLQEQQFLAEWKLNQNPTAAREALLFVLREITGKDYRPEGTTVAATP